MKSKTLAGFAGRLMRRPSAPFFEHAVREEVEKICTEQGLSWQRDEFGNVIVRLKNGGQARPFVLAAHMDHPGFEIVRGRAKGKWIARFLGGVPDRYFLRGLRIRLMPGNLPATLGSNAGKGRQFHVNTRGNTTPRPAFAVWDLEGFAIRSGKIHGRGCDDLIGVATILTVMSELKREQARVNVIGIISRAEEIGFLGALAVTDGGRLPKNSLVISLETSRELPGVKMGEGVILRVGDKTSIFDTEAMRFLTEVCGEMRKRDESFRYQRGLMSGGTCEATAFQEFGFQTGAVCVALGNYHNCARNNRIAAEFVDLSDAAGMANLLKAAARAMPRFRDLTGKLPKRLEALRRSAKPRLRRTA
jgi:endoglucanase